MKELLYALSEIAIIFLFCYLFTCLLYWKFPLRNVKEDAYFRLAITLLAVSILTFSIIGTYGSRYVDKEIEWQMKVRGMTRSGVYITK